MLEQNNNPWDKFYKDNIEYTVMHYPFGIVIEFIKHYLSKNYTGGGNKDLKNIKILEFGCGSGANILYAAQLGLDVYGVDISSTVIDYAKSKFKKANLNVNDSNFQVCSFEKVSFPDNYFDMIIDRGALIYADKETYIKTINNIHKMLKKGGMLLLTPRSEVDTPTIKLNYDEYGFDARSNLFKDKYHTENTFSLKDIVKILDNRFEFLVLRRNDRVDYILSKDGNGVSGHEISSMYDIFLEKK